MERDATSVDVLALAAHPPDLRGLQRDLGAALNGSIRGIRIRAKTVGIGLPVAAARTARCLTMYTPRAVVFLGTCGVYPGNPGFEPHDVIVASSVRLLDHAQLAGWSTFPDPLQAHLQADPVLAAALTAASARAHLVDVASPLAWTRDDSAAEAGLRIGCQAESLESFAIAQACSLWQIPFGLVLGATHVVGSRGEADWRRFERESAAAASNTLIAWAQNGAPGLPHG